MMRNTLGALEAYLGDLNRIKKAVKILGFVAGADDFTEQAPCHEWGLAGFN